MAACLYFARVSSVNRAGRSANVCLSDRENQVVRAVPYLAALEAVPDGDGVPRSGDTVAVIFEDLNGQIGRGVILGKV